MMLLRLTLLCSTVLVMSCCCHKEDQHPYVNNPDSVAWSVFQHITAVSSGAAAWESWPFAIEAFGDKRTALESSKGDSRHTHARSDSLVFGPSVENTARLLVPQEARRILSVPIQLITPHDQFLEEVRLNEDAFAYAITHQLNKKEVRDSLAKTAGGIAFPPASIFVKGQWVLVDSTADQEEHRVITIGPSQSRLLPKEYWELSVLHISSKQLPMWFWATFEDSTQMLDKDQYPVNDAKQKYRPPSLNATEWRHFVLVGTQVSFTDTRGKPIVLGNSQIESGCVEVSSCMTCHAQATFGEPILCGSKTCGKVGSPDPAWFKGRYQADSVWSLATLETTGSAIVSPCAQRFHYGPQYSR